MTGEHEIVIDLDRASRRLVVLVDGVAVERRACTDARMLAQTVIGIDSGAGDVELLSYEELVAERAIRPPTHFEDRRDLQP